MNIKALLFGKDFISLIPKLLKHNSDECIECSLGNTILGGISFDQRDKVENNITIDESNQIILKLKKHLKKIESTIEMF